MWEPASKRDENYNCIAWALGHNDKYMWPSGDWEWPRAKPTVVTVQEFIDVFALYGYTQCDSHIYEEGFEKIALFVEGDSPEHAAVSRRDDGKWMSKLGVGIDILHDGLSIIEDFPMSEPHGPCTGYGKAQYFFKKRRSRGLAQLAKIINRFRG